MRAIYRYEVPINDEWHEVKAGKVVFATPERRLGRDRLEVWVDHESVDEHETMELRVFGTGHTVPEGAPHVASVRDDPFVWHVFERGTA